MIVDLPAHPKPFAEIGRGEVFMSHAGGRHPALCIKIWETENGGEVDDALLLAMSGGEDKRLPRPVDPDDWFTGAPFVIFPGCKITAKKITTEYIINRSGRPGQLVIMDGMKFVVCNSKGRRSMGFEYVSLGTGELKRQLPDGPRIVLDSWAIIVPKGDGFEEIQEFDVPFE